MDDALGLGTPSRFQRQGRAEWRGCPRPWCPEMNRLREPAGDRIDPDMFAPSAITSTTNSTTTAASTLRCACTTRSELRGRNERWETIEVGTRQRRRARSSTPRLRSRPSAHPVSDTIVARGFAGSARGRASERRASTRASDLREVGRPMEFVPRYPTARLGLPHSSRRVRRALAREVVRQCSHFAKARPRLLSSRPWFRAPPKQPCSR